MILSTPRPTPGRGVPVPASRPSTYALGSPFGGERSEVAVVNDGPVDRQSRDRARRSALSQG